MPQLFVVTARFWNSSPKIIVTYLTQQAKMAFIQLIYKDIKTAIKMLDRKKRITGGKAN